MTGRAVIPCRLAITSLALASSLTGCGARTALEIDEDAGARDAPSTDTARPDAPPPDAPMPACPRPSDVGFRLEPLAAISRFGAVEEVALGGDGVRVVLALTMPERTVVAEPTIYGALATEVDVGDVGSVRLQVIEGDVRGVGIAGGQVVVLAADGALEGLRVLPAPFESGPLFFLQRPTWNGRDLVIAGQDGGNWLVGPWVPGGVSTAWRLGSGRIGGTATADGGQTHVFAIDVDGRISVVLLDRDGASIGLPVRLLDAPLASRFAVGWSADGTGQPWIAATFVGASADVPRAALRRYRLDGAAAGGFSMPVPGSPTALDLSTSPPVGHAHGYGFVAGHTGDRPGVLFHGAGEDFVGDGRPVPAPCDGNSASIASGPCGYVIACTGAGGAYLSLAVPPRPR